MAFGRNKDRRETTDSAPHELGGPVGDELARAGAEAGDPAAAGTGMEGAPADAAGGEAAGALGSAAASPEQPSAGTAAEAATAPGPGDFESGDADGEESGQSFGDRIEAVSHERPEVLVGAAFAGGLALARVLAAVGGDR